MTAGSWQLTAYGSVTRPHVWPQAGDRTPQAEDTP